MADVKVNFKIPKTKPERPNTLVVDHRLGLGLEYIKEPPGHRWRYGKNLVYCVARLYEDHKENGSPPTTKLIAVEPPAVIETLPEKLYRATHWKREAKPLFGVAPTWLDKFNMGLTVALILGLMFFIFLIFDSSVG